MYKILLLPIILITFFSCHSQQNKMAMDELMEVPATEQAAPIPPSTSTSTPAHSRKIIWTANIRFQVENVDSSTAYIKRLVNEHDGFISDMNMRSTNYEIANTIQIRIGKDQFDHMIESMKGQSVFIDHVRISSNDVTEEFVDIESRLKTKKEARYRYIDILRNKTGDVKDIIEAEEAIRVITEEIEAQEGRLRYLKDKVSFSTINVTIYQKVEFVSEPKVFEKPYIRKFADALFNGWQMVTGFFLVLANIWPLILVIGLFIWKRKWLKAKFKNGKD